MEAIVAISIALGIVVGAIMGAVFLGKTPTVVELSEEPWTPESEAKTVRKNWSGAAPEPEVHGTTEKGEQFTYDEPDFLSHSFHAPELPAHDE